MEVTNIYKGDVPAPFTIDVRDDKGRSVNLFSNSATYEVVLQHNGRDVDVSGISLDTTAASLGRFILDWPDESPFTNRGEYLLQIRITGNGSRLSTTPHVIRVKELGRD